MNGFAFIRRHWFSLLLLVLSVVVVRWYVTSHRAPGAMTVIEAQGMDMTDMKAPLGTMPVSTETATLRSIEGGKSFPATVSALAEEEVVARVPGRLSSVLVYPGDKVRAGQLLATIDAPEYEAQRQKAEAMSEAKTSEVVSAERMVAHHRNVLNAADAATGAAKAGRARSETDVEAASLELAKSQDELIAARSAKDEKQAELTYADQDLAREGELHRKGAISLDELQASRRSRDAALSRVQGAQAAIGSVGQSVRIAEKRLEAARQMVSEADAQIAIALAGAGQAKDGIAQAHADANAKRFESRAAAADAAGASTFADYRQLRALSNGMVSERLVSSGTSVSAGQAVLRLQSVGLVRVGTDVPERLSGSIRLGATVLIQGNSGLLAAKLTSIFPSIDPQTRTFRVEALVSNPKGALRPGMFVHVELKGGADRQLAVRSAAIQSDESGSYLWTVQHKAGTGSTDWTCTMHPEVSEKGPGKCPKCGMDLTPREKGGGLFAHRARVTVGKSAGEHTAVVAGLSSGDQVIWAGFEDLIEGAPVKPSISAEESEKEQQGGPAKQEAKGISRMERIARRERKESSRRRKFQYVCLMDKDVVSDKPGKCPKCGMDLVKRGVVK